MGKKKGAQKKKSQKQKKWRGNSSCPQQQNENEEPLLQQSEGQNEQPLQEQDQNEEEEDQNEEEEQQFQRKLFSPYYGLDVDELDAVLSRVDAKIKRCREDKRCRDDLELLNLMKREAKLNYLLKRFKNAASDCQCVYEDINSSKKPPDPDTMFIYGLILMEFQDFTRASLKFEELIDYLLTISSSLNGLESKQLDVDYLFYLSKKSFEYWDVCPGNDMSRLRKKKKFDELVKAHDHDNIKSEQLEGERRSLECKAIEYVITGKEEEEQDLLQGLCRFSSSKSASMIDVTFVVYNDKDEAGNLFNKLEMLKNRIMVKARFLIEEEDRSIIVVEGTMCYLRTWMSKKKHDFIEKFGEGGILKNKWWNFIRKDFKNIFRDVIYGIWCFYDVNISFVNFSRILVDNSGNAKLLPSLSCFETNDGMRKDKDIVDGLRKVMEEIICAEYGGHVSDFNLPYDLLSSFEFFDPAKLTVLPFKWLINSSFFWETSPRIRVLNKLCNLIDRDIINKYDADNAINAACNYIQDGDSEPMISDFIRNHDTKNLAWVKEVTKVASGGIDTIFTKVFYFSSTKAEDGTIVVHYDTEIDLARYFFNFIKHHNHKSYRTFRRKKLEETKIEEKLRQRLPNAYADICITLYLYALDGCWTLKGDAIKELLGCFDSSRG